MSMTRLDNKERKNTMFAKFHSNEFSKDVSVDIERSFARKYILLITTDLSVCGDSSEPP